MYRRRFVTFTGERNHRPPGIILTRDIITGTGHDVTGATRIGGVIAHRDFRVGRGIRMGNSLRCSAIYNET
jgi:hypothetical protein